jgi:UDP-N-acetylmuramoyl-L-alanyl-D-glutamate--2,6-diaminopimelate ligase
MKLKYQLSLKEILSILKSKNLLLAYQNFENNDPKWIPEALHTRYQSICDGDIFLTYETNQDKALNYLKSAIAKNANLIISEFFIENTGTNQIQVTNARSAWAFLMAAFYKNPQDKLTIVGITGTNGKTSTAWLLKELLALEKKSCVCIGTLGILFPNKTEKNHHTTPDPSELYKAMAYAVEARIFYIVMEVSSHSIAQNKIDPIQFAYFIFTSFSQDHLDYHHSMREYGETKIRPLYKNLKENAQVLINTQVLQFFKEHFSINLGQFMDYGSDSKSISIKKRKNKVEIKTQSIALSGSLNLLGEYTLENFLAAWMVSSQIIGRHIDSEKWSKIQQIPGRLEAVNSSPSLPHVFIDYAHTPDALEKVLKTLTHEVFGGEIWAIFGCGGNRDQLKRPMMATVAEKYADHIVLTTDNPRTENPQDIIEAIAKGFSKNTSFTINQDREEAIKKTILSAKKNDIILIAGKGHEDYQTVGEETFPFSDSIIAKKYLLQREQQHATNLESL